MIELQDVFTQHGKTYRKNHKLPPNQLKEMRAIKNCRTSSLGAHIDECDECGYTSISYNSCRNRHCPKCQTLKKELWIDARKADLLDVGYFHIVFTISDTLNPIAYQNQEVVYKNTVQSCCRNLDGTIGG